MKWLLNGSGRDADVQPVVNRACFCHTSPQRIQGRMLVLAKQKRETYKRHRPETKLLYQLVERDYPKFTDNLAKQGKPVQQTLPRYPEREDIFSS